MTTNSTIVGRLLGVNHYPARTPLVRFRLEGLDGQRHSCVADVPSVIERFDRIPIGSTVEVVVKGATRSFNAKTGVVSDSELVAVQVRVIEAAPA